MLGRGEVFPDIGGHTVKMALPGLLKARGKALSKRAKSSPEKVRQPRPLAPWQGGQGRPPGTCWVSLQAAASQRLLPERQEVRGPQDQPEGRSRGEGEPGRRKKGKRDREEGEAGRRRQGQEDTKEAAPEDPPGRLAWGKPGHEEELDAHARYFIFWGK